MKNALDTHHRAERLLSNHLCDQMVQTLNNEKKTKLMTDKKTLHMGPEDLSNRK